MFKITNFLYVNLFVLCGLGGVSFVAYSSDWQFDGFLSQGYMAVEDSQFVVGDDSDSFELTEAALAASWKINKNLRFAGSLNYRRWGELAESKFQFDYGFLEYSQHMGGNKFGLRGGRFKNEFGFYSSTRDAPFTRPSIMLPQSIYSDFFRDTQLQLDGVDFFGSHSLSSGVLDWHASVGNVNVTDDLTRNVNGSTELGSYSSDHLYAFDVDFQGDTLRLGLSYYSGGVDFRPSEFSIFTDGSIGIHTWLISAQYRYKWLEVTAEHAWADYHIGGIFYPEELGKIVTDNTGFYIDIRAYLPYSTEVFIRFDRHIGDTDDKNGVSYSQRTGFPAYYANTDDWALGARWFISSNWMLAAEYHWLEGASWTTPLIIRDPVTQQEDWSMFALQLSYRF